MTTTCCCGHEEDEHGGDPDHPGSFACHVDGYGCFEFEAEENDDNE